jgi:hypothetical protein
MTFYGKTLPYVTYAVQGVTAGYTECAISSCAAVGSTVYVTVDVIVIA